MLYVVFLKFTRPISSSNEFPLTSKVISPFKLAILSFLTKPKELRFANSTFVLISITSSFLEISASPSKDIFRLESETRKAPLSFLSS